jgi:YrbI family 3-deoxy-D-manno-octulosonate 8-phosphate phosphatase
MGIKDKKALLDEFFSQNDEFAYEKTAYIGDDVNDAECLKLVKFSAAPSDAAEENLQIVNYVCKKAGGQGCVREICDILRKNEAEIL